ncbi:MAG TPA: nucleotidyltransferase domain-containing protein [Candidatus Gastranaerophilales bacterium]|nr:nucleotidyltransferase domain-containing protein [Candidatus Gastranaerophilales bacterium]
MKEQVEKIIEEFKNKMIPIYKNQLVKLILFGSQARNEAVEGSDIDIIVILKDEINPAAEINKCSDVIAELSLKFDIVISCIFAQEDKFNNKKTPLFMNIKKEGIIL